MLFKHAFQENDLEETKFKYISKMPKQIFITIEGNIGSGKSTLLNRLRAQTQANIQFIDEPVGVWTTISDENNKNLLELFYEDKVRWGYTFQNAAFITRYICAKEALSKPIDQDTIYISERGILTDRYVFATMLKDTKCLSEIEWNLYTKWFDQFKQSVPINGVVYVKTPSNVCADRIKIRNRHEEENIPQTYLDALDDYHNEWLHNETSIPVLEVTSDAESVDKILKFATSLL